MQFNVKNSTGLESGTCRFSSAVFLRLSVTSPTLNGYSFRFNVTIIS